MREHAFYPTSIPTVPRRRKQVLRFFRWLVLFLVVALMMFCMVTVIIKLVTLDAELDAAFLQGMTTGAQLCRWGA